MLNMLRKINKIIRILIISDFVFFFASGLVNPIFAIFITEQIRGGNVKVVGISASIFLITKSALQIPIGILLDKIKHKKSNWHFLFWGSMIISLVFLGYYFSKEVWHIYLLQAIYGIGTAISLPPWLAIFTRRIDKGKEATEWSIESTATGIAAGISGVVGGFLASVLGFRSLFLLIAAISLFGTLILIPLYGLIEGKEKLKYKKLIRKYPPV